MKRRYLLVFPAFFLLISALFVMFLDQEFLESDRLNIPVIPKTGQGIQDSRETAETANHSLYWLDEFEYEHPRWDWGYETTPEQAGRRLVVLPNGNPGLECWVTSEASSAEYSDCSLRETEENYEFGIMEAHLRLTDDNGLTDQGKGTRGWGFWDGNLDVLNVAWFWSASPESDPGLSGFRVMVMRYNEFLLNQEISVDMREWHTYRVEMTAEGTKFYVNGIEIASTTGLPANQQRIELWVDNMAVQVSNGVYSTVNLDLIQDQEMYIDWVEYRSSPVQPVPTEPPPTQPPPTQPSPTQPTPTQPSPIQPTPAPLNHQIFLPWLKR